jgi:2'-5' RNA ligase
MTKITMYYVAIPVTLTDAQEGFRDLYDPKYGVNEAHATLVAPFSAKLMTPELDEHFSMVSSEFHKQEITAQGFYISDSGYIFYTFDENSNTLLTAIKKRLHEHSALDEHQHQHQWSFLPHITLGKFEEERRVPELVRSVLPELCHSRVMNFDRFRLYAILNEASQRAHVKDYLLQKKVYTQ